MTLAAFWGFTVKTLNNWSGQLCSTSLVNRCLLINRTMKFINMNNIHWISKLWTSHNEVRNRKPTNIWAVSFHTWSGRFLLVRRMLGDIIYLTNPIIPFLFDFWAPLTDQCLLFENWNVPKRVWLLLFTKSASFAASKMKSQVKPRVPSGSPGIDFTNFTKVSRINLAVLYHAQMTLVEIFNV